MSGQTFPVLLLPSLLLLAFTITGCGKGAAPRKAAMEKKPPILKIAVFSDDRLTVDGAPSTIQDLRESLRKLSEEQGVVWYYREAGQQDPPPIATEVINEIVAARVPVRLSSKPDYSDSIGP
jgi:hypothetical protein